MNDFVNAKKWYTRASDLGSVDASINLGYLYEKNSDWANARKYYERAASKKDPLAMYNLAIVLGNHFGQGDKGCELLNEAITIKTIDADTLKLAKSAIAKGCSGSSVKTSSASPSTLTQSMDPNVPLSPSPSYSGSSYSEPLSSSLKSSSIFGRAFISGTDWIIPLTNSADETIPPINRVQIKDSTQPYGQWWNISYTLRNNGSTGWSAVVSDYVLQFLHSTDGKLCPEFRLALVQGGKVTYIWNKSVAPCIP
jgi:tetratricopeptide (TPR) repeat protein